MNPVDCGDCNSVWSMWSHTTGSHWLADLISSCHSPSPRCPYSKLYIWMNYCKLGQLTHFELCCDSLPSESAVRLVRACWCSVVYSQITAESEIEAIVSWHSKLCWRQVYVGVIWPSCLWVGWVGFWVCVLQQGVGLPSSLFMFLTDTSQCCACVTSRRC